MTRQASIPVRILNLIVLLLIIVLPMVFFVIRAQAQRPTANRANKAAADQANSQNVSFLSPVSYPVGAGATGNTAIEDLTGDGKLDIVASNQNCPNGECGPGSVSILLGNGDGTFLPPVLYDTGGLSPSQVAVADLNGDGKPDIAVTNYEGIGVLLGNGDGTFQPAVYYETGGTVSLAIANLTANGKLDIVVGLWGLANSYAVLLGNGDGTFQPAVSYNVGMGVASVTIADMNHDGKPDLVLAGFPQSEGSNLGQVGVLLGNGDGTFQSAQIFSTGAFSGGLCNWVAVADLNGDGNLDVAVANYGTAAAAVGVLLGKGDGTLQPVVNYAFPDNLVYFITIADVNGDHIPDLLVPNYAPAFVSVMLGNGDGTFQPAIDFSPGLGAAGWVSAVDVNGDGRPDLEVPSETNPGVVNVLLNNTGAASTTTALASSANPARRNTSITYTATVTSQYGGAATGTITFHDGSATVATVSLANNQAAYLAKYKSGGVHTITALYSGDLNNLASTSTPLTEYVESYATKTTLTTSGSPSQFGQVVTFTAKVTPIRGTIPNGESVTFYDGNTAIGTGLTASGVATFATSSLKAVTHTIKAAYPGDDTFEPSIGSVKQVVEKYSTTTALTSSVNASSYGQAVTFTATVTSAGPTPTGKVKFMDGTTALGSSALHGGVAKLSKSTLVVGSHSITAEYLGDANSAESTSSVLDQVVQ